MSSLAVLADEAWTVQPGAAAAGRGDGDGDGDGAPPPPGDGAPSGAGGPPQPLPPTPPGLPGWPGAPPPDMAADPGAVRPSHPGLGPGDGAAFGPGGPSPPAAGAGAGAAAAAGAGAGGRPGGAPPPPPPARRNFMQRRCAYRNCPNNTKLGRRLASGGEGADLVDGEAGGADGDGDGDGADMGGRGGGGGGGGGRAPSLTYVRCPTAPPREPEPGWNDNRRRTFEKKNARRFEWLRRVGLNPDRVKAKADVRICSIHDFEDVVKEITYKSSDGADVVFKETLRLPVPMYYEGAAELGQPWGGGGEGAERGGGAGRTALARGAAVAAAVGDGRGGGGGGSSGGGDGSRGPLSRYNLYRWKPSPSLTDDENYLDLVHVLTRNSICLQGHMACVLVGPHLLKRYDDARRYIKGGGVRSSAELRTRLFSAIIGVSNNFPLYSEMDSDVHAEIGALGEAARRGKPTEGCTAYITMPPCKNCFGSLSSSGIARIVSVSYACATVADAASDRGIEMVNVGRARAGEIKERVSQLVAAIPESERRAEVEAMRRKRKAHLRAKKARKRQRQMEREREQGDDGGGGGGNVTAVQGEGASFDPKAAAAAAAAAAAPQEQRGDGEPDGHAEGVQM